MQIAMQRIVVEAHELYPTTDIREYNARMATIGRQSDFIIRELRFELRKNPELLNDLSIAR